jgi:FemAB-related protein (PEP-CTERM system-associated)
MIRKFTAESAPKLREFLDRNPNADYAHAPAWLPIIRETYGKEAHAYLWQDAADGPVRGVASVACLESPLGRKLVCLPYLDYGGPLAETAEIATALIRALTEEATARKARLEIRSRSALPGLPEPRNEKVGMILPLKDRDHEAYWKSLDAKVRNQVRKAEKSNVKVVWGREDRLDDFYRVFCVNMRDLGSPTHAKSLFSNVLKRFPGAGIGAAYREGRCIGGLFRIHWKDSLVIPWASTLREERTHSPNNALYWESIRHAFEQGCALIDFGRSSKDEGTYKFKKQWLAEERPLCWSPFDGEGKPLEAVTHISSGKLQWVREVWARMPLPLANALGPRLRGHISA